MSSGAASSHAIASDPSETVHWRGLLDRWKALQRLTWAVSLGLNQIEEHTLFDLSAFLMQEEVARQLERHGTVMLGSECTPEPRPVTYTVTASGVKLLFPLTEPSVLNLLSLFCRQQLPDKSLVVELLTRQIELLKTLPNVVEFTVPAGCEMCVVGDLHGQFNDLMHIFRSRGFPSPTRPYLFNGDFVDRGDCGVEVTLTLYAWQQLHPSSVFLNRGNHEERSVHSMYGFQQECTTKYDRDIYELFNDTFIHLPIGSLLNQAVLVVHGGIDEDMTMELLRSAPRTDYVVNVSSGTGGGQKRLIHPAMRAKMAEFEARDLLHRPINSALWNDPMQCEGTLPNKQRGTGKLFGPDVTRRFLDTSSLQLLIRSHEQVAGGFEWPYGTEERSLVTVFSASNYAGKSQNKGAVVMLSAPGEDRATASTAASTSAERSPTAGTSCGPLGDEDAHKLPVEAHIFPYGSLRFFCYEAEQIPGLHNEQRNVHKLRQLLIKHRAELTAAYAKADEPSSKRLPVALWGSITSEVLNISFPILYLRMHLLGQEYNAATVDYGAFLRRFQLARPELDPIYRRHEHFLALMFKVDADGTGEITIAEFIMACAVMAQYFENEPGIELYADPQKLLSALGPAGELPLECGRMCISMVADQFRLRVEHGQRPSLLSFMHHLDRNEILNIARPGVPMVASEDTGSPARSDDGEGEC